MTVLVAYATKHGSTQEIAERIAKALSSAGQPADVQSVQGAQASGDLNSYSAFVIGSAVYAFRWRKQALAFVLSNQDLFVDKPVWLFSSGPLGDKTTDAKGRDLRSAARPRDAAELERAAQPRSHQVFFGALDPDKLTVNERLLRKLPAAAAGLIEGDFRDWAEIDRWALSIAAQLPLP